MLLFSITWGAVSGWWLPACLALGLIYAWVMYRQPVNLDKNMRYALFALRAIVVFIIALLLVSPLIKSVSYKPEKPLVLIAQDNSQSIKLFPTPGAGDAGAMVDELGQLQQQLGDGYEVHAYNFSHSLADGLSKKFDDKQTDISAALGQLNERYVNQNTGALVLATDGITNQGSDPQYAARNFKANIYTIALGDTVAKRDLLIGNVNYNKTAFLGNDFEIEVLAEAYQSKGESMRLNVTEDGRQVSSQIVDVNSDDFKKVVTIKLNADRKGTRKFNISIIPIKNELSTQNNQETIYVEVLDVKQKIVLLYDGPHPDIAVIRQAIESNKNYEVKTGMVADLAKDNLSGYSLAILYQLSANSYGILSGLIKSKTPLWYMAGAQTDLQSFNMQQKLIRISSGMQEMQEVFALPMANFASFTLTDSTLKKIYQFPPLLAPYGNYGVASTASVLFRQKIGSIPTTYPLLAFGDNNGKRIAVLAGEGLWRWQLSEYELYGNHHAVEELLGQSVQYLTANANNQHFRVYPAKNIFDEGENVLINAELYNDALEAVNTPDVKIDLKSDSGKNFSFLFSKNGASYQLNAGALPAGEYSFNASTTLGNKHLTTAGQLTVKPLNLELRQSAANHQLLNNIAKQSGGKMLQPSQIGQLANLIRKNENIKTLVYEDKHYSDIIDVKSVFVLILALLSAEWFLRKREGEI